MEDHGRELNLDYHITPQRQARRAEIHNQEIEEAYRRLAASPDFGLFYAAMREKMEAARSILPTKIVTDEDQATYNQGVGFIQGLEVMFMTVRRYIETPHR